MLNIDKYAQTPIYEQLIDSVEKEILLGVLREGDAMPSVRELSATLGINPNTIQKAYIELDRRGIIASSPGIGSFVREGAADAIRQSMKEKLQTLWDIASELRLAGIPYEDAAAVLLDAYDGEPADRHTSE